MILLLVKQIMGALICAIGAHYAFDMAITNAIGVGVIAIGASVVFKE